jgi:hypothetical protein
MVDYLGGGCDLDELRELFAFDGLSREQLARLCPGGT